MIRNILPKYRQDEVDEDDYAYAADIERIRVAFNTDSASQKEKLKAALRDTAFIMVVDAGDGKRYVSTPDRTYIATDRLKQLFAGVGEVFIVDDSYECLRGESVRELLESCGAVRYPRPEKAPPENLWSDRLKELRAGAGHAATSGYSDRVEDWTLRGFQALLDHLPKLMPEQRVERARLIWESLSDLEERRGRGIFDGSYTWTHNGRYSTNFPAAFVRTLNVTAWVPDANGELVPPSLVVFDTLGWKSNPFLLTKITFKPPIIDQLAKEAGIDPAALDLLRKLGITSVADLTSRLGITNAPTEPEPPTATGPEAEEPSVGNVYDGAEDLWGTDKPDIPPGTPDPDGGDGVGTGAGGGGQGRTGSGTSRSGGQGNGGGHGGSGGHDTSGSKDGTNGGGQGKRSPGHAGGRPFISYVGTHPDEDDGDPDGLDQAERMRIEAQAIDHILQFEPNLNRTVEDNPGFDLYEMDTRGNVIRWIEVKSMTGSLEDRPVGVSRAQLDFARDKGTAYWLYVVEYATDPERIQVLRICDPAGLARTFTFDHGWKAIALTLPAEQESV